jgi:hypothetical protein
MTSPDAALPGPVQSPPSRPPPRTLRALTVSAAAIGTSVATLSWLCLAAITYLFIDDQLHPGPEGLLGLAYLMLAPPTLIVAAMSTGLAVWATQRLRTQ